jgi:hypothetical protein
MLSFAFNIKPAKAEPRNIVVPDDYSTIQEAINSASYGGTIFVKNKIAISFLFNCRFSIEGQ